MVHSIGRKLAGAAGTALKHATGFAALEDLAGKIPVLKDFAQSAPVQSILTLDPSYAAGRVLEQYGNSEIGEAELLAGYTAAYLRPAALGAAVLPGAGATLFGAVARIIAETVLIGLNRSLSDRS